MCGLMRMLLLAFAGLVHIDGSIRIVPGASVRLIAKAAASAAENLRRGTFYG